MAQQQDMIPVDQILGVLKRIQDPQSKQDIVSLGWVGEIQSRFGNVTFTVYLPEDRDVPEAEYRSAIVGAVKQIPGVKAVMPNISRKEAPKNDEPQMNPSQIRHMVVVGSGKGGVGKSTSSVNLAIALAKMGKRVGLLDGDIYGPSVPTMLAAGHNGEIGNPEAVKMRDNLIVPFEMFGVKVMSVAMLIEKNQPTVWRAPIATKMINQFLSGVDWGELDYLIIDLPPGTGDIQLTISQQANIAGAVIVTTPQKVALNIAEKGLLMFQHVGVPVLGLIETMSGFGCDSCGATTAIFGEGGAEDLSKRTGVKLLAQVPLDAALVRAGDDGEPIVKVAPESASAKAYVGAAKALDEVLEIQGGLDGELAPIAVEGIPHDPHNGGQHSLAIYWSDGKKYVYGCRELRYACPCAECVDEFTGKRTLKWENVAEDVYIDKALPVGRYGVNLVWSDGHSTGIYTYDYLRKQEAKITEERPEIPPEQMRPTNNNDGFSAQNPR